MVTAGYLLTHPLLVLHTLAALFALGLAPINLVRRRRDRTHRMVGRVWIATMALTALTSFGVQQPVTAFSWLHALSVWTLVSLALGLVAIRRRNRPAHVANMIGCYVGLWVAFLFAALVPTRTLTQVTTQSPLTTTITVVLVGLAVASTWWVFRPRLSRLPVTHTVDLAR